MDTRLPYASKKRTPGKRDVLQTAGGPGRRLLVAAVLAVCLLATEASNAPGFKVVVHPALRVTSLSRAALSSAFLKRTEKWPDGTRLVPVDQLRDSAIREAFCREIHKRGVGVIDAYWQKQVFSGRTTPPVVKANDAEVIAYVRSVRGAIGYVSAKADTSGLQEVRIE